MAPLRTCKLNGGISKDRQLRETVADRNRKMVKFVQGSTIAGQKVLSL
jgi:hypothetical protein